MLVITITIVERETTRPIDQGGNFATYSAAHVATTMPINHGVIRQRARFSFNSSRRLFEETSCISTDEPASRFRNSPTLRSVGPAVFGSIGWRTWGATAVGIAAR